MLMSYDVSFMNLSATETVSHIHGPAEPGAQAGVQVDLPLGTPKVGEVTITEQQQADMLAGLFYLNIHSGNCPGGEIRGQILIDDATTTTMPATTTTMAPTTTLPPMGECGDGTVDPGEDCDPGASGSGECCTDSCTFVGAGTACGEPGNACTDADSCDGAGTCVPGDFKPAETPCFSPEDTDCTNPDSCNGMGICLARNEPDGTQCTTDPCGDAATCQGGLCTCPATTTLPPTTTTTLPQTMFSFSTVMDCEQATTCGVPPCTGAGSGSFTLDTVSGAMGYDVSFMNLSADETVSHIHGPAESGVQAGVAVDLPNGTPKIGAVVLSAQQQEEMLAGLYYVNVHSGNCPGGEIRGQILLNEAVPIGSGSFEVLRRGAVFY